LATKEIIFDMFKALIFDSFFDKHRGVVAYIRLFSGSVKKDETIYFLAANSKVVINEVGIFKPEMTAVEELYSGEVGYVVTGLKDLNMVKVGDTICSNSDSSNMLPGYKIVEPKVFSSIFPVDASDYPKLKDAIAKLKLSDASLSYELENIPALGFGFRCGFLGILHMDIVQERLTREFDLNLILTTPSVEYHVVLNNGEEILVHTPTALPDPSMIKAIKEPKIKMEIITPESYIGKIMDLITTRRGMYGAISSISTGQIQMSCTMPLSEMIVDFYDDLKSATKGYATMSYEISDYEAGDLVKVDVLVHSKVVDPLSFITHRSNAEDKGRHVCAKLKEEIPRQQFDIPVQAAIGARIIARETIKSFRKDVTAKLYGGDITRRMKLLDKQKEGKKRMKMVGNVEIPQSAFMNILKK
jgi:GTP-binding protein LepA